MADMNQIMGVYADSSFLDFLAQSVGFIPIGFVLGLIAWAFGHAVVIFLQTIRKAI